MMRLLVVLFLLLFATAAPAQESLKGSQGDPVGWTVMGGIKKLPNGGRPEKRIDFPKIRDWSTLKITLERGACFGTCPAYSVRITGDGTVSYDGSMFVAITGKDRAHISEDSVLELYNAFREADFFWLFDSYSAPITDNPTYEIGIAFDGHRKKVTDYVGRAVGMPRSVTELEDTIDRIADTAKWVSGNSDTFAILAAEGHDFRSASKDNLSILAEAARNENGDLVRKLLSAGMPANSEGGCEAVMNAVQKGNAPIVKMLLAAGAPVHTEQNESHQWHGCDALQLAAQRGFPEILSLILAQRPDVNATGYGGMTPLMDLCQNDYTFDPRQDYAASAKLLIAAGAKVNARAESGDTPLMMAHHDSALVSVLLASGADEINQQDRLGLTALMNSTSPEVTELLLQAGANPWIRDTQGRTALELAEIETWRNTAATLKDWIQKHPK